MLHLAQPERAVAEAFRVLSAAGGSPYVWAKPEEAVVRLILDAIAQARQSRLRCRRAAVFPLSDAASATTS